ncbi:hypothetical protein FN846DRAFT_41697 [Sphaerosporella brunnea]|uniref:Uncharacterized protein n=1 Tax=Sphaerosporella brunnea TaxID=1250544 RepID=A0A5J5FAU2_9PEZI|nr:hypothetical protein FN846DRAFT_41697 [Sphaerosporella brunnea]
MQSGGHRTFSFEAHDDTNSFQYTHLGGEPPYNPHHLFAPKQQQQQQQRQQQQQQYLSPASPEPQYRSASTAWDHPPPDDTDMSSEDESGGMEHQPTVIRRSIPPASAAAAAAALQVVQEDLTPTRERAGFWGPETDLSPTPASQAPLLPPTATTTPRGLEASPRRGVLVDPLLGQYSDNPYKRMSTTWDPAVTQSGFDGAADVLSDDEEQGRRGGKKAALAVGGAGGGAMAVTAVTVIGAPGGGCLFFCWFSRALTGGCFRKIGVAALDRKVKSQIAMDHRCDRVASNPRNRSWRSSGDAAGEKEVLLVLGRWWRRRPHRCRRYKD